MAHRSKIRFEWDGDREGLLWAIRDKGSLTLAEVQEALREQGFAGYMFTITFYIHEDSGYVGWNGVDEPEGETWKLWKVEDGCECPICGKLTPPQYCEHCGAQIVNPAEVIGDGKS